MDLETNPKFACDYVIITCLAKETDRFYGD